VLVVDCPFARPSVAAQLSGYAAIAISGKRENDSLDGVAQGNRVLGRIGGVGAFVEPGTANAQRGTQDGQRRVRVLGTESGDHFVTLLD
jgi:hypothetical protein